MRTRRVYNNSRVQEREREREAASSSGRGRSGPVTVLGRAPCCFLGSPLWNILAILSTLTHRRPAGFIHERGVSPLGEQWSALCGPRRFNCACTTRARVSVADTAFFIVATSRYFFCLCTSFDWKISWNVAFSSFFFLDFDWEISWNISFFFFKEYLFPFASNLSSTSIVCFMYIYMWFCKYW